MLAHLREKVKVAKEQSYRFQDVASLVISLKSTNQQQENYFLVIDGIYLVQGGPSQTTNYLFLSLHRRKMQIVGPSLTGCSQSTAVRSKRIFSFWY